MKLAELTDDQYKEFLLRVAETVVDNMDYKTMDAILCDNLIQEYETYNKEDFEIELCEWFEEDEFNSIMKKVTIDTCEDLNTCLGARTL